MKRTEEATDILAKRIMPKQDFEKVIQHDHVYGNSLNQLIEFLVIKQDILGAKSKAILEAQTKDSIVKNIDTLVAWADTQVRLLDLTAKKRIQEKLIKDKETHFSEIFIPQWNKEVKETKENFDVTFAKAKELVKLNAKGYEEINGRLTFELEWYAKVEEKKKTDTEVKLQLYKPLKRLLSAYERLKKENEEAKKLKA
tara:strand:- start:177 stop:770 length:594 start_codon:yes stop_codon:yes gene_type:complete